MVVLPVEVIESNIMVFADMDGRIAMGCIRKISAERIERFERVYQRVYRRGHMWCSDDREWMMVMPITDKKQFVLTMGFQGGSACVTLYLVDFRYLNGTSLLCTSS